MGFIRWGEALSTSPTKIVILGACDFFDLALLLRTQSDVFNPSTKPSSREAVTFSIFRAPAYPTSYLAISQTKPSS